MRSNPRERFAASFVSRTGMTAVAAFLFLPILSAWQASSGATPGSTASQTVTFAKDVVPILQRSCQNCHHPDGIAPMSLMTYEEVRPFARSIKTKTGLRVRPGSMPPWFVEKNVGIQTFKNDTSLSEAEIAKIAQWVDNGAPLGNPADLPAPLKFDDAGKWVLGEPDLVLKTPTVSIKGGAPDWWGPIGVVDTPLIENRYVKSVEYKEISDIAPSTGDSRKTVGSRFIFHHLCWGAGENPEQNPGSIEQFPCHEVGRNADVFDPDAPRLLKAGTKLQLMSTHVHSNGRDTKSYVEIGFRLFPPE